MTTDYIKRIQSNLSRKNIKLSKPAIREEVEQLGYSNETLTDDLAVSVLNKLVVKFSGETGNVTKNQEIESSHNSELCHQVAGTNPSTNLENDSITDSLTELSTDLNHVQEVETCSQTVPETEEELILDKCKAEELILDKCEAEKEIILDKLSDSAQVPGTGIVVSEEEKHDLITSQATCLGIELSEVEVVDLATSLKDDFLDYESFIDEVVTAVVTYHDHRTDKLEQKIKDAREHIEYRRKQLNQTLVGEFGEMNQFFRQGAAKRRELSKVIAAAFKT